MSTPTHTREEFLDTCITPTAVPVDDPECPICKDTYDTSDHQAVTFSDEGCCKHVYGKSCLVKWLETENTNTCAMCRRELFCLPNDDYDSEAEDWELGGTDDDFYDYSDEEEWEKLVIGSSLEGFSALLEDIWYKIWWLRTTSKHSPCGAYLTHLFLTTMARHIGVDVDFEGCFDDNRMASLDAFLLEMMDAQKLKSEEEQEKVIEQGKEKGKEAVPAFSDTKTWVEKLVEIPGFEMMGEQSSEVESSQDATEGTTEL
jgi:hypothetical protein